MNNTKLNLSHDEMVVLAAIADQELMFNEIKESLSPTNRLGKMELRAAIGRMIEKALLVTVSKPRHERNWQWISFYAIAPNILALNNPPYSYESWRDLSE